MALILFNCCEDHLRIKRQTRKQSAVGLQLLLMSVMLGSIVFFQCDDQGKQGQPEDWFKYLITPADLHLPKSVIEQAQEKEAERKKSLTKGQ